MKNKRWTPRKEVTPSLLKFREKRKWQIALRRYILEGSKSIEYAPYFGIDIAGFRSWIELQFTEDLHWDNFGKSWQFDHIVPVTYFNFSNADELKICWNFINIRVEKLELNKNRGNKVDVIAAKAHFEKLFNHTGFTIAGKLVRKIEEVEISQISSTKVQEEFLLEKKDELEVLASFSSYEYQMLNTGSTIEEILAERRFLAKFGD